MSQVKVESTTDTADQVIAATGDQKQAPVVEETSSASAEAGETSTEESDTSEVETEGEEIEAKGDDDESEDDEAKLEADKPKRPSKGFKKRINKLTSQLTAERQEKEYWRQEAMKTQKPADGVIEMPAKVEAAADNKPKAEDFESHEAYIEALTDWKVENKTAEKAALDRQAKLKAAENQVMQDHFGRVKEFSKSHSDFNEKMEELDGIIVPPAVQEILVTSENGPELMYALAEKPEEFKRICGLSPLAAARAIGVIEAELKKAAKPETVKTTKAPKPVSTVNSRSVSAKSPDEMSFQEYKKWRDGKSI